jgi:hypothetical protein
MNIFTDERVRNKGAWRFNEEKNKYEIHIQGINELGLIDREDASMLEYLRCEAKTEMRQRDYMKMKCDG